MSSCIYHDFEAVAICPSCDFGVCQTCLDGGDDGTCATCSEEQRTRDAARAVRSQAEVTEGPRCLYCRVAQDDQTPLDQHGYCEACAVLNRCHVHEEAIAIGHCKNCRREYCRKCLGFADVCQSCTAQKKTKPLQAPVPQASRTGPTKPGTKKTDKSPAAKGTGPTGSRSDSKSQPLKGEGTGRIGGSRGSARPGGPSNGKGSPNGSSGSGEGRKRSRRNAKEELPPKPAFKQRLPMIIGASVFFVLAILFFGDKILATSPATLDMNEQVRSVHRGVVGFTKKYRRVPRSLSELTEAVNLELGDNKINLSTKKSSQARTVVYQLNGNGYFITATDGDGRPLFKDGVMVRLDQYSEIGN